MPAWVMAGLLAASLGAAAAAQPAPLALRDAPRIVATEAATEFATAIAAGARLRFGPPEARVETLPWRDALRGFCAGTGPATPDLLLAEGPIPPGPREACRRNGVTELVELELGEVAVILAIAAGAPRFAVTEGALWRALAAGGPGAEPATWRSLRADLPPLPIRLHAPAPGSALGVTFTDTLLEGGCRGEPGIRAIADAAARRARCLELRPGALLPAIALAPDGLAEGSILALSLHALLVAGPALAALPVNTVTPGYESIDAGHYDLARPLVLTVKLANAIPRHRMVAALGIREVVIEAASEYAAGPNGYLAPRGLVWRRPAARAANRRLAASLPAAEPAP